MITPAGTATTSGPATPSPCQETDEALPAQDELMRGLSGRHLQMIAIGGAIGTGLFVASGGTISQAGPGGALVAYTLVGLMAFLLMQSLGEMAAKIPVAGSFQSFATRFVSPSFGFAIGWNYWFNWAITVAAELVAAGIIMDFWFPSVPGWVWAGVFLIVLTGLNALSAKAFGESEFWLSLIKVGAVVLFLIAGVLMIFGILGENSPRVQQLARARGGLSWRLGHDHLGLHDRRVLFSGHRTGGRCRRRGKYPPARNTTGDPHGLLAHHALLHRRHLHHRLPGSLHRSEPAGLGRGRRCSFPVHPGLRASGHRLRCGIDEHRHPHAIFSAGNSGLYASTRMLYSMAHDGKALKVLGRTNSRDVPIFALLATAAVGLFGLLSAIVGQDAAYAWLLNVSGLSGFIVWAGIAISHSRFRRGFLAQGNTASDLPHRAVA